MAAPRHLPRNDRNPLKNRTPIPPVVRGALTHEGVTFAEHLYEAGYFTAHIGKEHLGGDYYPKAQGLASPMTI